MTNTIGRYADAVLAGTLDDPAIPDAAADRDQVPNPAERGDVEGGEPPGERLGDDEGGVVVRCAALKQKILDVRSGKASTDNDTLL
jgi:hypothetical protein